MATEIQATTRVKNILAKILHPKSFDEYVVLTREECYIIAPLIEYIQLSGSGEYLPKSEMDLCVNEIEELITTLARRLGSNEDLGNTFRLRLEEAEERANGKKPTFEVGEGVNGTIGVRPQLGPTGPTDVCQDDGKPQGLYCRTGGADIGL